VRPHVLSWTLSPCLEWLFADGDAPFVERVRAAARAGFRQVEFWTASNKDVELLTSAIEECGVYVTAFVSEPVARIVDPATHDAFLDGIERSCALARRWRAQNLIILSGDVMPDVPRTVQHDAIAAALDKAGAMAAETGVAIALEPLNLVDHPGYFLDSTIEGLDIVRSVGRPNVKLLFDLYHSVVMGEDMRQVLANSRGLLGHVHIADAPGRHEPGTGAIDWASALETLHACGYDGALGVEYKPATDTISSLEFLRRLAG
jgi:hydroxypyruvate isomerase